MEVGDRRLRLGSRIKAVQCKQAEEVTARDRRHRRSLLDLIEGDLRQFAS
jgi:hypothetical protein